MEEISINLLTKSFLQENLESFISILKDVPGEYWTADHFLMDLNDKWHYSLVSINKEKKITGYIIASRKGEGIHIHKFMVDSKYRGQRIGKKLLTSLEEMCKKNNRLVISLKVSIQNKNALRFYENEDFNIVESDNLYYLMKKIIA